MAKTKTAKKDYEYFSDLEDKYRNELVSDLVYLTSRSEEDLSLLAKPITSRMARYIVEAFSPYIRFVESIGKNDVLFGITTTGAVYNRRTDTLAFTTKLIIEETSVDGKISEVKFYKEEPNVVYGLEAKRMNIFSAIEEIYDRMRWNLEREYEKYTTGSKTIVISAKEDK